MILLYHQVFPDNSPPDQWSAGYVLRLKDFVKQIRWLKKRFYIISLEDYLAAEKGDHKNLIAITFDDGYFRAFSAVEPFLKREHIPATFFLNTIHLEDSGLPWFVYINAVCHEKIYPELAINGQVYSLSSRKASSRAWSALAELARNSGDAIAFVQGFSQHYPLPEEIVVKYIGLSEEQILKVGACSWLEVGGHTHSHPYLDHISPNDQLAGMVQNKRILEGITGDPVRYFAYPGGVYNAASIEAVKQAGFEAAFAIRPLGVASEVIYEMPRTDIYSPALWKFGLKVLGLIDLLSQEK